MVLKTRFAGYPYFKCCMSHFALIRTKTKNLLVIDNYPATYSVAPFPFMSLQKSQWGGWTGKFSFLSTRDKCRWCWFFVVAGFCVFGFSFGCFPKGWKRQLDIVHFKVFTELSNGFKLKPQLGKDLEIRDKPGLWHAVILELCYESGKGTQRLIQTNSIGRVEAIV